MDLSKILNEVVDEITADEEEKEEKHPEGCKCDECKEKKEEKSSEECECKKKKEKKGKEKKKDTIRN